MSTGTTIIHPQIITASNPHGEDYAVYIQIYDQNGNVANGNGIVVYYIETINGASTYLNVTIQGQSYPIYYGSFNPGYSWTLTDYTLNTGPNPPVVGCDLVINYINPISLKALTVRMMHR